MEAAPVLLISACGGAHPRVPWQQSTKVTAAIAVAGSMVQVVIARKLAPKSVGRRAEAAVCGDWREQQRPLVGGISDCRNDCAGTAAQERMGA